MDYESDESTEEDDVAGVEEVIQRQRYSWTPLGF